MPANHAASPAPPVANAAVARTWLRVVELRTPSHAHELRHSRVHQQLASAGLPRRARRRAQGFGKYCGSREVPPARRPSCSQPRSRTSRASPSSSHSRSSMFGKLELDAVFHAGTVRGLARRGCRAIFFSRFAPYVSSSTRRGAATVRLSWRKPRGARRRRGCWCEATRGRKHAAAGVFRVRACTSFPEHRVSDSRSYPGVLLRLSKGFLRALDANSSDQNCGKRACGAPVRCSKAGCRGRLTYALITCENTGCFRFSAGSPTRRCSTGTRRLVSHPRTSAAGVRAVRISRKWEARGRPIVCGRARACTRTYLNELAHVGATAAFSRRAKAARLCRRLSGARYDAVAAGELHLTGRLTCAAAPHGGQLRRGAGRAHASRTKC